MHPQPAPLIRLDNFRSMVAVFCLVVDQIPESAWKKSSLDGWDLRTLVAHTARGVTTAAAYVGTLSEVEQFSSAESYLQALFEQSAHGGDGHDPAIHDLGANPAHSVRTMAGMTVPHVEWAWQHNPLIQTQLGGIYLHHYLPTRTFEIAVHTMDIANAAGIEVILPDEVVRETVTLGALTAARLGQGHTLLMALTGRARNALQLSVVP